MCEKSCNRLLTHLQVWDQIDKQIDKKYWVSLTIEYFKDGFLKSLYEYDLSFNFVCKNY